MTKKCAVILCDCDATVKAGSTKPDETRREYDLCDFHAKEFLSNLVWDIAELKQRIKAAKRRNDESQCTSR